MAAFRADPPVDELGAALAAALAGRGLPCGPPTSIERAIELNVELGGRLVSILVGQGTDGADDRFVSIGTLIGPSGRLLGLDDSRDREALAAIVDEALRDDLLLRPTWTTPAEWRARTTS
jgi:hypothetical protein